MDHGSSSRRRVCTRKVLVLPRELIEEILLRLPIRYLKQFECVAKSWLAMIQDPDFIYKHLYRSPQNPMILLSLSTTSEGAAYVVNAIQAEGANFPCSSVDVHIYRNASFVIVNSCQGLICSKSNCIWGPIMIWNPVTTDYMILHSEQQTFIDDDDDIKNLAVGFGYHHATKEYKVIRIYDIAYVGLVVSLQTLGTSGSTWTYAGEMKDTHIYDENDGYERAQLVGEYLYWIVTCGRDSEVSILSFDVGTVTFCKRSVPALFNTEHSLGLSVLSGSLSIYIFDGMDFYISVMDHERNTWSSILKIPLVPSFTSTRRFYSKTGRLHGTLKEGIYLFDVGDSFGAYDIRKKSWEFISWITPDAFFTPYCHIESLVSPRTLLPING